MNSLTTAFQKYFIERKKLSELDGWIGKSTAADVLTPIYMALRELKMQYQNILKEKKISWTVQTSIGQGTATPDHYLAILPPGQKASNGIYFGICFDRSGTGCVMGAMTSLQTNQRIEEKTIVRANSFGNDKKNLSWEMITPHTVNIWGRNNAFYNPQEFLQKIIDQSSEQPDEILLKHLEQSQVIIERLLLQRKNLF